MSDELKNFLSRDNVKRHPADALKCCAVSKSVAAFERCEIFFAEA